MQDIVSVHTEIMLFVIQNGGRHQKWSEKRIQTKWYTHEITYQHQRMYTDTCDLITSYGILYQTLSIPIPNSYHLNWALTLVEHF